MHDSSWNSQALTSSSNLFHKVVTPTMPLISPFSFQLRMSKTAEAVSSFLSELCEKLRPLGEADLEVMLQLKEEEVFLFIMQVHIANSTTLTFKT